MVVIWDRDQGEEDGRGKVGEDHGWDEAKMAGE